MLEENWTTAKGEAHIVPISYHLAKDPMHMRLLEICKNDIVVLADLLEDEHPLEQLNSYLFQALIWEESNCVAELPIEGHFP
jgi:hypothetical protein